MILQPPFYTLFPYTTLFRSHAHPGPQRMRRIRLVGPDPDRHALHHLGEIARGVRSEEHTSALQSHCALVCRLLLHNKEAAKQHDPPAPPVRQLHTTMAGVPP